MITGEEECINTDDKSNGNVNLDCRTGVDTDVKSNSKEIEICGMSKPNSFLVMLTSSVERYMIILGIILVLMR